MHLKQPEVAGRATAVHRFMHASARTRGDIVPRFNPSQLLILAADGIRTDRDGGRKLICAFDHLTESKGDGMHLWKRIDSRPIMPD